VIIEGEPTPPEGACVEVNIIDSQSPTWGEVFRELIGSAPQLPPDIAENHDHYIHGGAK
jgi:hypothetical protein